MENETDNQIEDDSYEQHIRDEIDRQLEEMKKTGVYKDIVITKYNG